MARACLGYGGHRCGGFVTLRGRCDKCRAAFENARNRRPWRMKYDSAWAKESADIRADQPWCTSCGTTNDLTVDHPTRSVLCRSCHSALEARRRALRAGALA
jgi:hypothetical protein